MQESTDERNIEKLKPKMKTLERLELLDVAVGKTVVTAKLDGELELLVYSRNGESYTLNKWAKKRTDYPALNQFVEAMNKTGITHAELLCELYAMEDGKPTNLPTFISLIKGENRDLNKIHIAIWDLLSIDGKQPRLDFRWKFEEVTSWIQGCSHVSVVPFTIPFTLQDVKDFWNIYVEGKGYEGLVIRQPTQTWKIKPTLEVDAVVIGLNKKTSYGKELDLFQKGQVTSLKLALMTEDGNFIELSDCASGITAELRTSLWKLMEMKVAEDDRTVFITPVAVCTIQYTDTFIKRRQVLKFDGKQYRFLRWQKFVSLRHPRLLRFRPDKDVTVQDLRMSQIPESKLPEPEERKNNPSSAEGHVMLNIPVKHDDNAYVEHKDTVPRIVKPSLMFSEALKNQLFAEGWGVNSADYMKADTPEQAVELQAKSFPCVEFQPVQLPDRKWVAFHRTFIKDYLKAKEKDQDDKQGKMEVKESEPFHLGEEKCSRQAFGNFDTCIAEHRGNCNPHLQKLCKEKSQKSNDKWNKTLKRHFKYVIEIQPPSWIDHKYALFYSKNYGDNHGGATEFKTKQDLLNYIRKLFSDWQHFDSIVGRHGDKPTTHNLYFKSFTDEITKMELFGDRQLFSFGKNE